MNYWDFKKEVQEIIPRSIRLSGGSDYAMKGLVKEKGRKTNYQEGDIQTGTHVKKERLLNPEEMTSFLEVSLRAMGCPLPLNIDTWDGTVCPYNCAYCVVENTKIKTPKGEISIRNLKEGDSVETFNLKTQKTETKKVLKTMDRKDKIYKIKAKNKTIRITGEHPVYTKRGWIKVRDLILGDEVLVYG